MNTKYNYLIRTCFGKKMRKEEGERRERGYVVKAILKRWVWRACLNEGVC